MTAPFRFPRFFVTNPSPCPYLPGRSERKVFTELNGDNASELNDALGRIGFRPFFFAAQFGLGCTCHVGAVSGP